jgi:hypothetical protein
MNAQWQPSFSPKGYAGPSFRRGEYVSSAQQEETRLRWHLFRIHADETLERLSSAELVQDWNEAESIEFPRQWADETLAQAGWA